MPLPLPNLDDRRWADLVDEARALIPRYAPGWTDHNFSDPGITLLDALAWAVELDLFRVNRITDAYRGKFLRLAGIDPAPARPARVTLAVASRSAAPVVLPAGVVLEAAPPGGEQPIPFRTERPLRLTGLRVAAAQVAGPPPGGSIADRSTDLAAGRPFPAFGPDPAAGPGTAATHDPALLIGLTADAPPAAGRPLSLVVQLAGAADADDARDAMARAEIDPRRHHGARTEWEWFDGAGWQPFSGTPVADDTRALSLTGQVTLSCPAGWPATPLGEVLAPQYWIRCRLAEGTPDAVPLVAALVADAVPAVQEIPTVPPTTIGPFAGEPGEAALVPGDPLLPHGLTVSSTPPAGGAVVNWQQRPDLDAAAPSLPGFVLSPDGRGLTFGDGDRGRTAPAGQVVTVDGFTTRGAAGTPAPGSDWQLAASDVRTRDALGADANLPALRADLAVRVVAGSVRPGVPATGIATAEGRAAEALWVHERLLAAASGDPASLDQIPPATVDALRVPERACTLVDFERIARAVPGTSVARARAWAGHDAGQPCLRAPGTVTVIVVPELPAGRPRPTAGLLRTVRHHLAVRRTLGTRVVVVGPRYVEVTVVATVTRTADGLPSRIRDDVLAALRRYLDPLVGGPAGLGWPFGRDVPRSEVLQVVAGVPGVDYVARLELIGAPAGCPPQDAGCGGIPIGPTMLTTSGTHRIEVV